MKKFSQRGVLLFGVMLVVCAFMPSLASAASWSPLNSTHDLFSSNLSFTTVGAIGQAGSICNRTEFHAHVASANTLEITSAGFADCMGQFAESNCTVTATGNNFPWTATATDTTNVQIHGVNVTAVFENTPGNATACALAATVTLTGTLTGGAWVPATNTLELTDPAAMGLTALIDGGLGSSPAFVSGTVRDTVTGVGALRMLM